MENKVLILQFKSKQLKRITLNLKHFRPGITGAEIKRIMEAIIESGTLKIPGGEEAVEIHNAYYSIQVIENILINEGHVQEQLKF